MGTNFIQRADGGVDFVQDSDSAVVASIGGAYRSKKVAKKAIAGTATTTGGALFSWANPEGAPIIVTRFLIDITTKSTGAAAGVFGVAANATTSADNLIDTYALGATEKVVDNLVDKGTNGKMNQRMTASQYITGTCAATSAGLVGNVYIEYILA